MSFSKVFNTKENGFQLQPDSLFVLFLSADEKEEGILGSILLPSFHVSMLSVEDHINRKYAFKVSPYFSSHQTVFVHIPCHRVS